jgi:outer membrane lipoprotein-sorting protein
LLTSRDIRKGRFALLFGFTLLSTAFWGQAAATIPSGNLSTGVIVQRMEDCNRERAQRLQNYTATRHYQVEYHGFPATVKASMDVDVVYDAPASKRFTIVSQSGSKLLVDRVLKRLLTSEQEAATNQSRSALTTDNYNFTLIGSEVEDGRRLYALVVEPKTDGKLLYRGKIWVDATDYAVVRVEAEPAQNPSFWIKKTEIHHLYAKTGDFWLPVSNRSVTKVRIGGTAVLTIDYGTYKIGAVTPPASPPSQTSTGR